MYVVYVCVVFAKFQKRKTKNKYTRKQTKREKVKKERKRGGGREREGEKKKFLVSILYIGKKGGERRKCLSLTFFFFVKITWHFLFFDKLI